MKVVAKASQAEDARDLSVNFDFGGNLDAMVELFGAETVFQNAFAQMKIGIQAYLRRLAQPDEDGNVKTDEEIQALANKWVPGKKLLQRKSKLDKATELLDALTDDQKAALLAKLTGG